MTAIVIVLLLLFTGMVVLIAARRQPPPEEVDPEQAMKAAVELHRIRRNLDVAWIKREQRRGAARVRREIAEAFEEPGADG
jgi:hypothetical protein